MNRQCLSDIGVGMLLIAFAGMSWIDHRDKGQVERLSAAYTKELEAKYIAMCSGTDQTCITDAMYLAKLHVKNVREGR